MSDTQPYDPRQAALFDAVRSGDLVRVKSVVDSVRGTGVYPPRLSLLGATDRSGQRAEELAQVLAQESPAHRMIADYLSGERLRMEYFE